MDAATRRAAPLDGARLLAVVQAHAEGMRRRHAQDAPGGEADVAPDVLGVGPVDGEARRRGRRRRRRPLGAGAVGEDAHLAGFEPEAVLGVDAAAEQEVVGVARRGERGGVPVRRDAARAVEVREDERQAAHDGEEVPRAAFDERDRAVTREVGVARDEAVQLRDEVDEVVRRAPVEVVPAVDVDLLGREPLDAVRDAPRALVGEERRERDAQARPDASALREAVVVVRLGEVDERAVRPRAPDRAGEVALEGSPVVGLEDLGVGPVEARAAEERVRHLDLAAEPFEHEDRVGVLRADARDDVLPRRLGDHVARVAAEAVHAEARPEEEDLGHVGAQPGVRVVELHEVGPDDAPGAGRDERAVRLAAEPVGVVGLERGSPARMVRGQVDEEAAAARVDGADELAELVERRRLPVELRHRGVDAEEVGRGERAAVLAHHRVGGGDGEDGERLDDVEAHRPHDDVEPARDRAEGPELAREDRVDRVAAARLRRRHLHREVAARRPFGRAPAGGEEAALAPEDAHLAEGQLRPPEARRRLRHRHVAPLPLQRRRAEVVLLDRLAAGDRRAADLRAEDGAPRARRVQLQRDGQRVAGPAEVEGIRFGGLLHQGPRSRLRARSGRPPPSTTRRSSSRPPRRRSAARARGARARGRT